MAPGVTPDELVEHALAARDAGELRRAEDLLRQALALQPQWADVAYLLGWVLHDQGEFEEAYRWARQALALGDAPQRRLQVGWLLQCLGRHEAAVAEYEALLEGSRDLGADQVHGRASLHLAQCLAHLGRLDEAWACVQQGLQAQPNDPDLLLELAWQQRQRRTPQTATATAQGLQRRLAQARTGDASRPSEVSVTRLAQLEAQAWYLLGVLHQDTRDNRAADLAFEQAHTLDPGFADALYRRAVVRHQGGELQGPAWLLDLCLRAAPDHAGAHALLAQIELAEGHAPKARRRLLERLRKGDRQGGDAAALWRALSDVQGEQKRPRVALRSARRATRLQPDEIKHWLALARHALVLGDGGQSHAAALRVWPAAVQERDADALALVAQAFACHHDWPQAQQAAEQALALQPDSALAWSALARLSVGQQRWVAAADAAERAVALDQQAEAAWQALLEARLGQHRPAQAHWAWLAAQRYAVESPALRWLAARALHLQGRLVDAVTLLNAVLVEASVPIKPHPQWGGWRGRLLSLQAQLMGEHKPDDQSKPRQICMGMLGDHQTRSDGLWLATVLGRLGDDAAWALLSEATPNEVAQTLRAALTDAAHTKGYLAFQRLAQAGPKLLPNDLWLGCAEVYAAALADDANPAGLLLQARTWLERARLQMDPQPLDRRVRSVAGSRGRHALPKLGYVLSQPHHQALLAAVVAAHDTNAVEVHVFGHAPWPGLPTHVRWHALDCTHLAAVCAAHEIDAVVDTGGLQPLAEQHEVVKALVRRVAPVQVGWIGSLASSGGVFDVLLADAVSIPHDDERHFSERVERLEGGQWCWSPPHLAPNLASAPHLARGNVTLGVVGRGLRLGPSFVQTLGRVMAAEPTLEVSIIGQVWGDGPQRAAILAGLEVEGVAAHRLTFWPWAAREDFWQWLGKVDLVLDTCPASGGLSLLDALWMGVPVLTRLGPTMGSRQAASVLHSAGLWQWVAADDDGLVELVVRTAADKATLQASRQTLRDTLRQSSLLNGVRVARQIETLALDWQRRARRVAYEDPKTQARAMADVAFEDWLAKPGASLRFESLGNASPDISVVVVLFNQPGLSLQCLQALQAQRGCSFEVVVVDNASNEHVGQLMARTHGATLRRNAENLGFLRAANQGAALAKGRHIAFLNNDAMLQPGALAAAVAALDADALVGALGGRVVLMDGHLQEAGNSLFADGRAVGIGRLEHPWHHAALVARSTDYVSGVFLATPAALWRQLGGFDETFAPAYYEDTDYCRRVWEAGFKVLYEPAVTLRHLESGSAAEGEATQAMERNRQRFLQRHAEWLATRPEAARRLLRGDVWDSPEDQPQRRARVLVVDNEVPLMFRGGGLPRARLMLQALAGAPVTLFPLWRTEEELSAIRESLPATVEVALGYGLAGLESFLEQRLGVYDVLLVSRPPNLEALAPLRKARPDLFAGMRLVYDAEAVFALRDIGKAAVKGTPLHPAHAKALIEKELALASGASDILVVSDTEAQLFTQAGYRAHLLSHVTWPARHAPGPSGRKGLLFVGAMHADTPNEDGLLWWLDEVLPRLAALVPDFGGVDVVGVCRSNRVAMRASDAVRVHGAQADLAPWYDRARVFIAPCRFAAGVPAKVIEAVAAGLPTVASALLVKQLGWQHGYDVLAADDAQVFAQAVAQLLDDDEQWTSQQQAGWLTCDRCYGETTFRAVLRATALGGTSGAIGQ